MFLVENLSNARIPSRESLKRIRDAETRGGTYNGKIVYEPIIGNPPEFDIHLRWMRKTRMG